MPSNYPTTGNNYPKPYLAATSESVIRKRQNLKIMEVYDTVPATVEQRANVADVPPALRAEAELLPVKFLVVRMKPVREIWQR